MAATYPAEANTDATKDNNAPVAPAFTAAPTFVQADIKTATVAGAETPSIPVPSPSADTIAQERMPGVMPVALAHDQRVPVSAQTAAQSANMPASPVPSSPSTAHTGAPAPASEITAKQVTPARPTVSPAPPATQPMPAAADPAVANTSVTPLMPWILQPLMPVPASAKAVVAPAAGKTSGTASPNANPQASGTAGNDAATKPVVHASDTGAGQPDGQSASQQGDPTQTSTASHSQATPQPETTGSAGQVQFATVTDHFAVNSAPAQPATGNSAHDSRTAETAAPVATPVHQVPEINTARLIQSVGQSEMRVGLRSTEFGNISIHTSATRDLVSTQISLDHDELAKTLATHLPEIQAKLGGTQPAEVRIDMNGQAMGQPSGQGQSAAGGMAGGSREQSSQQQPARANAGSVSEFTPSRPSAGLAHVAGAAADRRLDVTV